MTPHTPAEAEQALRDAITSGDPQRIAAAEADVDRLDNPTPAASLLSSALWYAEQGIPVFQLRQGRKQPLGSCRPCRDTACTGPQVCGHDQCHGLIDATTDPTRIARWWDHRPGANIGLATGHKFDVVDIDGPEGQKARAEHWDETFARVDAEQIAKVLTPRPGGMHIYVQVTGDGNATGIVPGIDYRGRGGYVLAPPSVITAGGKDHPGHYRFVGTPNLARLAASGAA